MENEVEVMRVIRVPPRGKLVVQVGGERFEQLTEVNNEAVGRRLMAAIGELVVFANGYQTLVSAGVAPPISTGSESPDGFAESLEERQAAFLASLEKQRQHDLLATATKPVVEAEDGEVDSEPLSIVEQINPLLQKYVAADPDLKGRNINLENESTGGLLIKVDGRLYERPEQIEDVNVRKALADALREWDSR